MLFMALKMDIYKEFMGFSDGSDGKASVCYLKTWVRSLGRENTLEKEMATHSSILAWKIL